MNTLTIKNPADLLSFIGHTLGFWPRESLVCVTLDHNKVGATLRIDLPRQPGQERLYARTVASYLTHDTNTTNIVFALYTSAQAEQGQPRPHAATVAALTAVLSENSITIRDGIFVGGESYAPYDVDPDQDISLPVNDTEYSQVNAEFIYRGSTIEPTNKIVLPQRTHLAEEALAVEEFLRDLSTMHPEEAIEQARRSWTSLLDSKDYPTNNDIITLIAYFQIPQIRDRLMACIPGIDEPPHSVLFAQTHSAPQWSRIEWAQQLLLHAYTRTSVEHSAPILTAIGYIHWWEGRGSKAHQYLQLALDADPGYRFARLSDHMLGAGIIAGWNTDRNTAYKTAWDLP
ncbi:DUF4192 domain-containing protein [Arthrobacter sp. SIMBA_036]|uniref:DUF4192 domain-containing protein n=1 Tax=Arthrobacter sp. SIMBA_036 TaxID=3085778 RepID=UPI003978ABE6